MRDFSMAVKSFTSHNFISFGNTRIQDLYRLLNDIFSYDENYYFFIDIV